MALYLTRKLDTHETRTLYVGSDLVIELLSKSSEYIRLRLYNGTADENIIIELAPNDLYILRTGELVKGTKQLEASLVKEGQPYIISGSANNQCDRSNPQIGVSADRDVAIVRADAKNQIPNQKTNVNKKVMT